MEVITVEIAVGVEHKSHGVIHKRQFGPVYCVRGG